MNNRYNETRSLQDRQLDADQAWEYLQSKGVPNLDIEREGTCKVTLVELLSEFAFGVYIGQASPERTATQLGTCDMSDVPHASGGNAGYFHSCKNWKPWKVGVEAPKERQ
jgi:hypothetical protein